MAVSVSLLEVSPRDGLQNEPELLSTEEKLMLIQRALGKPLPSSLLRAGDFPHNESGS